MQRPRPAIVILIASVVAFVIGIVWISLAAAPVDEASVGQRPKAEATASITPPLKATVGEVRDARGIGLVEPKAIRIPAINVETTVIPVGLDESRGVAVPEDIDIVGWWKLGVPPGAGRGSAVLVAHRDGITQGQGVFYSLGALKVGDKVQVEDKAGRVVDYRVAAREYIKRRALPVEELFAVNGPPRLTLISCGGQYIKSQGGYQDNIVVTATPV